MVNHSTPTLGVSKVVLSEVECPEPVEGLSFVYILLCADGTFYVGSAKNVERRREQHLAGRGAKHTHDHAAVRLVYAEGPLEVGPAVRREMQIKRWSRAKKLALITGDLATSKTLAKGKT